MPCWKWCAGCSVEGLAGRGPPSMKCMRLYLMYGLSFRSRSPAAFKVSRSLHCRECELSGDHGRDAHESQPNVVACNIRMLVRVEIPARDSDHACFLSKEPRNVPISTAMLYLFQHFEVGW
jgi:hypothetical protein